VGSLSVSQYVYAGGVIRAGEQQALLNRRKAEESFRETRESVAMEIYEAYCAALLKRADLETAADALNYYDKAVQELRKRLELGLSTKLDLARMAQQRENARVNLIAAKNGLSAARIVLFTLLRMPPEASDVLSGDLEIPSLKVDRDASVARALKERPDLSALRTAVGMQKEAVEIARAGLRPTAILTGSYQLGYDSSSYSSAEEDEWEAVLSVTVPLFDGGETRGKVAQEKASLTQAEQAVSKKEEAVRAEVVDACLTLESAAEAVVSARKNLEFARESLRLAEVGYREGVNTQLDVLDARTKVTEARQTLSEAQKIHRVALARLWRDQGTLVADALGR
jgi:outer membrane protein TolC